MTTTDDTTTPRTGVKHRHGVSLVQKQLDALAGRLTLVEGQLAAHVTGDIEGEPTPEPVGTWFGQPDPWAGKPFKGYAEGPPTANTTNTNGGIWYSGDLGGRVFSRQTFSNRPAGRNVIVFMGAWNFTVEDYDFDTVPEGIYLQSSHDFAIRRLRARNIIGPFTRGGPPCGNLVQLNDCWSYLLEDLKVVQLPHPQVAPYGTEDIISQGGPNMRLGTIRRFAFDGGGWTSPSGTGFIVGDRGTGRDLTVEKGILVNPGQVGIGTGEIGPYTFKDIDIWADRGNVAIQHRSSLATYENVRVNWPGNRVITNAAGQPITVPGVTAATFARPVVAL